jgi:predicted nucleic acid-binding protein
VLIVADAGPLNYLVLIDAIEVLPKLFGSVALPEAVASELKHPRAPEAVRQWMANPPRWASVRPAIVDDGLFPKLDAGERAAIALASALGANLLLIDDREGAAAAREIGIKTVGTIGAIDRAARLGFLDLEATISRLRQTNFRGSPHLFDALLTSHKTPKA